MKFLNSKFSVTAAQAYGCSCVVLVTFLLMWQNTMPNVTLWKKGLILSYSSEQYSQTWRGKQLYRWGRYSDRTRNLQATYPFTHRKQKERAEVQTLISSDKLPPTWWYLIKVL